MGSRLDVAEALRHAVSVLRELGAADATTEDESDAAELEVIATRIARRGRAEVTQEIPVDIVDAVRDPKETPQ
jgi:hypothetical protein